MRIFLYVALVVLYLLHNDLFLWNDECIIAGLPSGLLYHILFCIAASVLMFALVRFAWPKDLDVTHHSDPQS